MASKKVSPPTRWENSSQLLARRLMSTETVVHHVDGRLLWRVEPVAPAEEEEEGQRFFDLFAAVSDPFLRITLDVLGGLLTPHTGGANRAEAAELAPINAHPIDPAEGWFTKAEADRIVTYIEGDPIPFFSCPSELLRLAGHRPDLKWRASVSGIRTFRALRRSIPVGATVALRGGTQGELVSKERNIYLIRLDSNRHVYRVKASDITGVVSGGGGMITEVEE